MAVGTMDDVAVATNVPTCESGGDDGKGSGSGKMVPTTAARSALASNKSQLRRAVYVKVEQLGVTFNMDRQKLEKELSLLQSGDGDDPAKNDTTEVGGIARQETGALEADDPSSCPGPTIARGTSESGEAENHPAEDEISSLTIRGSPKLSSSLSSSFVKKVDGFPESGHTLQSKNQRVFPSSGGFNLCLLVGKVEVVVDKLRVDRSRVRLAEVEVGDETGTISLRARDNQVDVLQDISNRGGSVVLRNSTLELFQGKHLRLAVTKWGKLAPYPDNIASTPNPPLKINRDVNLSIVDINRVIEERSAPPSEPSPEDDTSWMPDSVGGGYVPSTSSSTASVRSPHGGMSVRRPSRGRHYPPQGRHLQPLSGGIMIPQPFQDVGQHMNNVRMIAGIGTFGHMYTDSFSDSTGGIHQQYDYGYTSHQQGGSTEQPQRHEQNHDICRQQHHMREYQHKYQTAPLPHGAPVIRHPQDHPMTYHPEQPDRHRPLFADAVSAQAPQPQPHPLPSSQQPNVYQPKEQIGSVGGSRTDGPPPLEQHFTVSHMASGQLILTPAALPTAEHTHTYTMQASQSTSGIEDRESGQSAITTGGNLVSRPKNEQELSQGLQPGVEGQHEESSRQERSQTDHRQGLRAVAFAGTQAVGDQLPEKNQGPWVHHHMSPVSTTTPPPSPGRMTGQNGPDFPPSFLDGRALIRPMHPQQIPASPYATGGYLPYDPSSGPPALYAPGHHPGIYHVQAAVFIPNVQVSGHQGSPNPVHAAGSGKQNEGQSRGDAASAGLPSSGTSVTHQRANGAPSGVQQQGMSSK